MFFTRYFNILLFQSKLYFIYLAHLCILNYRRLCQKYSITIQNYFEKHSKAIFLFLFHRDCIKKIYSCVIVLFLFPLTTLTSRPKYKILVYIFSHTLLCHKNHMKLSLDFSLLQNSLRTFGDLFQYEESIQLKNIISTLHYITG